MPPDQLLQAALVGFQYKLDDINSRIAELKAELNAARSPATGSAAGRPPRKRGPMSEATKRRMAIAQRRRWNNYHQAMKSQ